jgi:GntR family histidine utilization transcriptional repressor
MAQKPKSNNDIYPQSPHPLYLQVRHYIEDRIRSGSWKPETRIPSENNLVESLGISRMTVNRALRELTAEGHIIRLQGVGTFVAKQKPQTELMEIKNIADEIKEGGGIHSCDIHLLQEETVSPELAEEMGLSPGDRVYHSIMVHRDRGRAVQVAERYVNPVVAPDFLNQDYTAITPSEHLLSVTPVTEAEHVIEAVMPDDSMQELLEIERDEPCLVLYRKTWSYEWVATKNRFAYAGTRHRIGGRFRPATRKRME